MLLVRQFRPAIRQVLTEIPAGLTDEYLHLFVARVPEEPEAGPEPGVELLRMPFDEVVTAARSGRIRDVKTALALRLGDAREGGRPVG